MDWLSNEHLEWDSLMGIEYVIKQIETKGANSLPFDYEDALSQMLRSLQASLQRIAYEKMTKTAKSNDESSKLRALGNKWFSSSQPDAFDKAFEFYNKSIAYALPNSEEMALSYANRSAVLFKMNCYQECLDNIERALPNYPDHLKSKLYNRQAECYSQLAVESKIEAKVWLDKVPAEDSSWTTLFEMLQDCPEKKLQNYVIHNDCVVPEINSQSTRYPCASDAVEVQYSEQFGRHVVATRDIDVGEVIIVEKPYFQILVGDNLYTHCSCCMAFLWSPVVCDECVNSAYCSEECKEKAWNECHQMECTVSDLVRHYDDSDSTQIECLGLLLQMYREAGGLQGLKERITKICGDNLDESQVEVQDEWYQRATLESIMCLISHEDRLTQAEFKAATIQSFRIMFYLLTCTEFFGVKFDREETHDVDIIQFMSGNSDFIFVGRLIIKLLFVNCLNSYKSYELTAMGPRDLGLATAGLSSFFSHSCCPNTIKQFLKDHMVFRAMYPIRKGEQIFTCYTDFDCESKRLERHQHLSEFYFFQCTCIACKEDWCMDNMDQKKCFISIAKVWQRCQSSDKLFNTLYSSVFCNGHYDKIEELLNGVYKVIRAVYKEFGVNSKEMRLILRMLTNLYALKGNVRKYQNLSDLFPA